MPKAMSSPSKTLPSPAAAKESPAATETEGRGITPQLRGTRGNEGSSLAQRLSQSLTVNTPPVLSATTAENDDGSGKSKEELLALAHREIQAAFDSGLISAPELEAAKSRLSTTSYHFVPSRSATPVKPATTPSQPRSQGQHQPTPPPQRPTPPKRVPKLLRKMLKLRSNVSKLQAAMKRRMRVMLKMDDIIYTSTTTNTYFFVWQIFIEESLYIR